MLLKPYRFGVLRKPIYPNAAREGWQRKYFCEARAKDGSAQPDPRYEKKLGTWRRFFFSGGHAQILNSKLKILNTKL
jgi:hypothetical protein